MPICRMLILTEGQLGTFSSKTGASVLRYRRNDVVGVLDSVYAGQAIESRLDGINGVPIFAAGEQAVPVRPDAVLIGIAPAGGALPERMRRHLIDALRHGMSFVSGLHAHLRGDPEVLALA